MQKKRSMEEAEPEQESRRLKSVAEAKYKDSNIKSALKYAKRAQRLSPTLDGISSMVTTFKILHTASKSPNPNWYKILQVEPFAHTNTIKKSYKQLAFLLHPDKNLNAGSEEAFKLVNEAFRFLSDKLRRNEYDMKLRIKIQDEKIKESGVGGLGSGAEVERDTFWTACSTCKLLHQFERRYLGHNLVCPSCKTSFEAAEYESGENGGGGGGKARTSERLGNSSLASKGKMGRKGQGRTVNDSGDTDGVGSGNGGKRKSGGSQKNGEMGGRRIRRRMSSVGEVMERSQPKKTNTNDEMMTLAEMKLEIKQKAREEKMKMKLKLKHKKDEREKEKKEKLRHTDLEKGKNIKAMKKNATSEKIKDLRNNKSRGSTIERNSRGFKAENVEIMTVEDSDFYDFDKDRAERSFKKGQVWAIYDDDDGMPRHYGLIEDVSVYPFEVKMSWLDLQNSDDEWVASWEKMGFHVSCGRFKVSRKTSINSVNIFSHVVDCERVATEVYHIYPKKGSVWALYKEEAALDADGRNQPLQDKRSYDIVVFLTTFSEMHGLSMGYLEKVDGFKTVFKRREIGSHAIRCIEKSDVRLVSHQIPARKLNGDEAPNLLKDCWELDPASLPQDYLHFVQEDRI